MIFLPLCDPKAQNLDVFKDECALRQTVSVRDGMCYSEMQSGSEKPSSYHRDSHWLLGHPSICHHRSTKPGSMKSLVFCYLITEYFAC